MKSPSKVILIIIFLCSLQKAIAQDSTKINKDVKEKLNFTLGAGTSYGFNLGGRYQLNQMQLGLGINPKFLNIFGISSSFYVHLLGKSKLTHRKPWFLKLGLSYNIIENKQSLTPLTWHDMWADFYLGRDINLSKRIGFSLATGMISRFYSKPISEEEQPDNTFFSLGGGELNIYYRLLYK